MRVAAALLLAVSSHAASTPELFETHVRPVLAKHCQSCHGAAKQFSGLRLDSREAMLEGGRRGPVINTADPAGSLLLKALKHEAGLAMPPGNKLADSEIAAIEKWIQAGAPWPAAGNKPKQQDWYEDAAKTHWSFQPIQRKTPNKPIDAFLNDALRSQGLAFARPAEKRILMRRASFLLTGLPPTPADLDRFLSDTSTNAFPKAVDRLLASPHYGEHWARKWMDVVRYAETRGYEWNYEIVGAWRYRDYLIRAFNTDVPFDQLAREHIAGDLLENPRIVNSVNESKIGTAFYRLGEAGHDDCIKFREIALDVVDNQIDTLSKAFQGMTVSCARCHDHKLDPIPTADYYGLLGILNSSRAMTHTVNRAPPPTQIEPIKKAVKAELAELWSSIRLPNEGKFPLEHPFHAWIALKNEANFATAWAQLKTQHQEEQRQRAAFNKANFQTIDPATWIKDGLGLKPTEPGDLALSPESDAAITGILPRALTTHSITDRWNGTVRTGLLPKTHKYVSARVFGGKLAAARTVLDNCAIGEGYKVIDSNSPHWIRLTTNNESKLPVFLEVITKSDNPRIPDRPGVLKNKPEEIASPRSYFGLTEIVLHNTTETPREELTHLNRLFAKPITTPAELEQHYTAIIREAVAKWAGGEANDDDIRWLDAALSTNALTNKHNLSPTLSNLIQQYRREEQKLPEPQVIDGLGDAGDGFDAPIFRAGDPHAHGPQTPRHFLSKVGPAWQPVSQGSGRRQLADWIANPKNPLTARVIVNRVWATLFGRGIVATVDNFGSEGEKPTHPELLDELAAGFMEDGWSIKRLVRRIVLTDAFQQSSQTNAKAQQSDPRNDLLHHFPVRRLPAESLRDAILQTSGRLDRTMYGPSIAPPRTSPQDYRRLFNGPLDGNGRRGIYTQITRMEGPRFLEIFDYPNPMATRGARDITNVPAQALALLNDPFVLKQADVWADSLTSIPENQRAEAMIQAALGRPATAEERDRFSTLAQQTGWNGVAHVIFNLKEFTYLQ